MDKVSLLRKLIREEVVKAIRQEFPKILSEHYSQDVSKDYKSTIQNDLKTKLSENTNKKRIQIAQEMRQDRFNKSNPFGEFLNDTANSLDYNSFVGGESYREPMVVESVNDMLSSTRPGSSVENMPEIDVVPNFSNLMGSLKEKGIL